MQESILKLCEALREYLLSDSSEWELIKQKAEIVNPWFTRREIDRRVSGIVLQYLNSEKINHWVSSYNISAGATGPDLAIVAAGNIPLVCFHDILCALVCHCNVQIKLSSKDEVLSRAIIEKLNDFNSDLYPSIQIVDKIGKSEKYIVTGGNLSKEHFLSYLKSAPSIFRGHSSSIGIITGDESVQQLHGFGEDVFSYFGMGCRNITKLFVPRDYDFGQMIKIWESDFSYLNEHSKYRNNYEYQHTVLLLNRIKHVPCENILLVPNSHQSPPLSCLYYEEYDNMETLKERLNNYHPTIQAISGMNKIPVNGIIEPGKLQMPELISYQDNIDTIKFLLDG